MGRPVRAARQNAGAIPVPLPMKNLYLADLDSLTADDLEAFLALDQPPEVRPKEGRMLDYKSDVNDKFLVTIASFANTDGGLVFVGVTETNLAPEAMVGVAVGRGDLKTQLANKIATGVRPRVNVEIGIVPAPGHSDRDVAIIRVPASDEAPHMVDGRVPLRNESQTVYADVAEIARLLARADAPSAASLARQVVPTTWVTERRDDGAEPVPSRTFIRASVAPLRPLALRLDRAAELSVVREVALVLCDGCSWTSRTPWQLDYEMKHPDGTSSFKWRFGNDGRLTAVRHVRRDDGHAGLGDAVAHVLKTFVAGARLLRGLEVRGRVHVTVELALVDLPIAEPDARAAGIVEIAPTAQMNWEMSEALLDATELLQPVKVISELFWEQLVRERAASVDLDALEAFVARCARDVGLKSQA